MLCVKDLVISENMCFESESLKTFLKNKIKMYKIVTCKTAYFRLLCYCVVFHLISWFQNCFYTISRASCLSVSTPIITQIKLRQLEDKEINHTTVTSAAEIRNVTGIGHFRTRLEICSQTGCGCY